MARTNLKHTLESATANDLAVIGPGLYKLPPRTVGSSPRTMPRDRRHARLTIESFPRIAATDDNPLAHDSMLRNSICAALALLAASAANLSSAQSSNVEGPPPWRDNASVYLTLEQAAPAASTPASSEPEKFEQPVANVDDGVAALQPPAAQSTSAPPPAVFDPAVQHAFHQSDAAPAPAPNDSPRRLAPPSAALAHSPNQNHLAALSRPLPNLGLPWESVPTTLAALGIVVGFFLICTWLVRRGTRKATAVLPRDVVSVLGRVPLAARHVAQLLRVGNKLVLVSLTPSGAETLTEVTDPAEVDRLLGLCQQSDRHSTTKAFEQVFRQMSLEPASDGFLGYRGDAVRG